MATGGRRLQSGILDPGHRRAPGLRPRCPRYPGRWPIPTRAPMRLAISLKIHQLGLACPGGVTDLAHPAHPSLTAGERAVVLAPGSCREHDMGKAGGLGREDVVADEEFGGLKPMLDVGDVGFGIGHVFTEDLQGLDLASSEARPSSAGIIMPGLSGRPVTPQAFSNFSFMAGSFTADSPDRHSAVLPYRRRPGRCSGRAADSPRTLHAHVAQQHLQVGNRYDIVSSAGMLGDAQGVADHARA